MSSRIRDRSEVDGVDVRRHRPRVGNPGPGLCAFTAGFVGQVTPFMQRRVIDRGFGPEQWYCRGQSVVCGRVP